MDLSVILIVVVLGIYLVWKLMGTGHAKKKEPRIFKIGKHRRDRMEEREEE
jgi:hypothetical protein